MWNESILDLIKCKHRVLESKCTFCSGSWKRLFISGLEHHCNIHNDLNPLNIFEAYNIKSKTLSYRDEEPYVDAEFQYVLKCMESIELYDFGNLYIIANRLGRELLDIIFLQENYYGRLEHRHLYLRLKYVEKKMKTKEVFDECRG